MCVHFCMHIPMQDDFMRAHATAERAVNIPAAWKKNIVLQFQRNMTGFSNKIHGTEDDQYKHNSKRI